MIFFSVSIKKYFPALSVPHLSHLTYCTATKSNLYLSNSLAAYIIESALYSLSTFQVPNLMSAFRCLVRTKVLVQAQVHVYVENLSTFRPTPKLGDLPLSALRDRLFSIFALTLHNGGCFHLAIIFKFVTSKILFQAWKPMTISRKIISLI